MLLARRSVRRSWCPTFAVRIVLASSVLVLAASGPVVAQTGAISGTVTDSTTGAPIAGIWVAVSDASRRPVVAYMTTDSGSYTVGGLPAGTYYLNTSSSLSSGVAAEYLDKQYNGPTRPPACSAQCPAR